MEQKPKNRTNRTNKINKIQGRTDNKKKVPAFFKESVSHGSKVQKGHHTKFFFEEY